MKVLSIVSMWSLNNGVNFDYLAKVVFVRFLHGIATESLCAAHSRVGIHAPTLWEEGSCVHYLELFCLGGWSLLPHLFIYSKVHTFGYNPFLAHLLTFWHCKLSWAYLPYASLRRLGFFLFSCSGGIEARALHVLGKCCTTELCPQPLIWIFKLKSE
jgi:hypothetical protein